MNGSGPTFTVTLVPKRQLADARGVDDDWTGLKDAAERRKRQNRLNVRAHRRRQAELAKDDPLDRGQSVQITRPQPKHHVKQYPPGKEHPGCRGPKFPSVARSRILIEGPAQRLRWDDVDVIGLTFRLPVDQRLITLIHYNVLRACATNMSILSVVNHIFNDCNKAETLQLFPAPSKLPESLMPTPLQLSTPHERWIDLMPLPQMRDNAIRLTGTFDSNDLVGDVIGGIYGDFDQHRVENNGMLVWNDPWHVSGWELTAGFVKKWKFLIEGCNEMVAATNSWRAVRNEDPLVLEL